MSPLNRLPSKIAIFMISFYQKYLSPYKGYRCAYACLYGKASCATFGKQSIQKYGIIKGVKQLHRRLLACREAMYLLEKDYDRNEKDEGEKKPRQCRKTDCLEGGCHSCQPTLHCASWEKEPCLNRCQTGACNGLSGQCQLPCDSCFPDIAPCW